MTRIKLQKKRRKARGNSPDRRRNGDWRRCSWFAASYAFCRLQVELLKIPNLPSPLLFSSSRAMDWKKKKREERTRLALSSFSDLLLCAFSLPLYACFRRALPFLETRSFFFVWQGMIQCHHLNHGLQARVRCGQPLLPISTPHYYYPVIF